MKQVSTRLLIIVFFVTAFSFIGFFVVVTYKNVQQTKEQNNKSNVSLHFLLLSEKSVGDVEELNTTQRGYVFTSKEQYRQPYEAAVKKLLAGIDSFNILKKENPGRTAKIENITKLAIQKINDSKNTISIFDASGVHAVVEKIKTGISKKINGGIIRIVSDFVDDHHEILVQNSGQLNGYINGDGFGIKSTQDRLNLLYQGKAKFDIKNLNADIVESKITMPVMIS